MTKLTESSTPTINKGVREVLDAYPWLYSMGAADRLKTRTFDAWCVEGYIEFIRKFCNIDQTIHSGWHAPPSWWSQNINNYRFRSKSLRKWYTRGNPGELIIAAILCGAGYQVKKVGSEDREFVGLVLKPGFKWVPPERKFKQWVALDKTNTEFACMAFDDFVSRSEALTRAKIFMHPVRITDARSLPEELDMP